MAEQARGGRTFLEDLSLELSGVAVILARYAEQDARRREREAAEAQVSVRQVEGVIAARHARAAAFGLDLSSPGWSILLELFRAHLEQRAAQLTRLHVDARVAPTTVLRWLDKLVDAGLAVRQRDTRRVGGVKIAVTAAGAEAMHDYFAAVRTGWAGA